MDPSESTVPSLVPPTIIQPTLISAPHEPPRFSLLSPPGNRDLITIIKSKSFNPQYNCGLLSRPAELRNMIYEYALLHQGGIRCAIKDRTYGYRQELKANEILLQDEQNNGIETSPLNMLQLVCRFLYIETRGLLIKSNEILLGTKQDRHRDWRTAETLLNRCSPNNLAQLRRITLCTAEVSFVSISDAVRKLIGRLNAFNNSSLNLRVTVVVHDNALYTREQSHLILWVVALQEHIRGKTTIDLPDGVRTGASYLRIQAEVSNIQQQTLPERMRFTVTLSFPEDVVREEVLTWFESQSDAEEKAKFIMMQAQRSFDDGIWSILNIEDI